jgi:hypothetical protein
MPQSHAQLPPCTGIEGGRMSIEPGTIIPCKELSPNGRRIVAVVGYANDWAAYEQSYPWQVTDIDIAQSGDKIWSEDAKRLFPELSDLRYRP